LTSIKAAQGFYGEAYAGTPQPENPLRPKEQRQKDHF
jgi:hypothetical protein